ncbi:helix-turn-helix domain-containing protein [Paenibacillus sp. MBLB4367]|uniref:helix-turn-helix domain-containing protein n=1 Tax=Paenibacillus sp. MBLB4367 TaxID=3384767 RepID=UPI003907E89C
MINWSEAGALPNEASENAEITPQLAAKIVARRHELGLTQAQLAERAGLKQAAIARLERSGVIPRIDTLQTVARAMGLRLDLVTDDHSAAAM